MSNFKVGDNVRCDFNDFHQNGEITDILRNGNYLVKFPKIFAFQDYRMAATTLSMPESCISFLNREISIGDGDYFAKVVSKDLIEVGCQKVTRATIEKILKAMDEFKA